MLLASNGRMELALQTISTDFHPPLSSDDTIARQIGHVTRNAVPTMCGIGNIKGVHQFLFFFTSAQHVLRSRIALRSYPLTITLLSFPFARLCTCHEEHRITVLVLYATDTLSSFIAHKGRSSSSHIAMCAL
ncbi:hypothetical protein CERSUDRAFT_119037 [Gelatoporia subvermispora B]|uniref:Uncharacterized protein n=1 Tax=Ceriporiopsis subvermispora (strain B) TaxID=914234 RepID=M2P9C9_CERS8|nr:hypothetical protein CERSUDRAFT_119037 [Gelatoporia subvermispora B]